MKKNQTITITFCERAENHVGMQQIGKIADNGFTCEELINIKTILEQKNYVCELRELHNNLLQFESTLPKNFQEDNQASVLVIKNGIKLFLQKEDNLFNELNALNYDTKAFMYGRVVNKKARHNLCFADINQEADYNTGKGTIISFSKIPLTNQIRNNLRSVFGNKADKLFAEVNKYYDITKTGIGYHGDSERRIVIGVRLGDTLPLCYKWFHKGKQIGERILINLEDGDIYLMSEKAVGTDWKKKNIFTLRHAAGCNKFID